MAPIEGSVMIRARSRDVFAYVSDFRNDVRWRRYVLGSEHDPPGLAWLGTTVRWSLLVFGIRLSALGEVVEYDQDLRIATGPVPATTAMADAREVTPSADGCRFRIVLIPSWQGAARCAAYPLAVVLRRRLRAELRELKRIMEDAHSQREGSR